MLTAQTREMFRGDTLFFLDQVVKDITTGVLASCPAGQQPPQNSVPVDITGYTIWFTAKNQLPDFDNQSVAQLGNVAPLTGVVITVAGTGSFSVTIPSMATRVFPDSPVTLAYDIQVEDPGGRVSTIEVGTFVVSPDVTRTYR